MFQLLEDVLQLKRLKCVIDGHVDDDDTHYEGLLGMNKNGTLNLVRSNPSDITLK